jgi:excisionase family DNA binding protein
MRKLKHKDDVSLVDKIALSTGEACALAGVGMNTIYNAIHAGELVARKVGTRTIILRRDLNAWLGTLPKSGHPVVTRQKSKNLTS